MAEVQGADIIESEDVIGVAMCDQQSVELIDLFPQCLLPKVGGDVYDEPPIVILDHEPGTQPFIARIAGFTDITGATDHRYSDGCSGS